MDALGRDRRFRPVIFAELSGSPVARRAGTRDDTRVNERRTQLGKRETKEWKSHRLSLVLAAL